MNKVLCTAIALALLVGGAAPAAANHTPSTISDPVGEPLNGPPTLSVGDWSFIRNYPAGPGAERPLGVDVEMFTRTLEDGKHNYVLMSSTTMGFSIFDVTDPANPIRVSDYGAAVCGTEAQVQQLMDILARGQDFGASSTAFGVVHGWEGDVQVSPDGKIVIYGTDAAGRCHDPGFGGMEIVDISDPASPSLLGLVRLLGESHNTTLDLDRPWLVYNSNSDTAGNNFIDIVDIKSCLALDPAKCLPHVSRFQFEDAWTSGSKTPTPSACHDLTFALHKLYGACINTSMVLDPSKVYADGSLTGTDMTDPKAVGEENACPLIDPSVEAMVPLKVVDCSSWTIEKAKEAKLKNANLRLTTLIRHAGINLDEDAPKREDVQISHKADPFFGGKLIAVNDERGGGTNAPPGECPGGGVWFYDVRDAKHPVVARTRKGKGKKAVFFPRSDHFVQAEGSNCTSHLFWEWPGVRHLVAMAWYSSGTQVFKVCADFSTHPATVAFYNRKTYVPNGASTWTSRIYAQKTLEDGKRDLYFAATDIARGFDFFKLTLPAKQKRPWPCRASK